MYRKKSSTIDNDHTKEFSLGLNKECSKSLDETKTSVLDLDLDAMFQQFSVENLVATATKTKITAHINMLMGINYKFEFGNSVIPSEHSLLEDVFCSYENCLIVMRMNLLHLWSNKSSLPLPLPIVQLLLRIIYSAQDDLLANETHRALFLMLKENSCDWTPCVKDVEDMMCYFGASNALLGTVSPTDSKLETREWTQSACFSMSLGLSIFSIALNPALGFMQSDRICAYFKSRPHEMTQMTTTFLLLAADTTVQAFALASLRGLIESCLSVLHLVHEEEALKETLGQIANDVELRFREFSPDTLLDCLTAVPLTATGCLLLTSLCNVTFDRLKTEYKPLLSITDSSPVNRVLGLLDVALEETEKDDEDCEVVISRLVYLAEKIVHCCWNEGWARADAREMAQLVRELNPWLSKRRGTDLVDQTMEAVERLTKLPPML